MNTTTASATRPSRRRIIGMFGTALVATLALSGFANTHAAPAWTSASASGRPGAITVATIYVGDLGNGGNTKFTLYGNTSVVVYRSPATSGTQTINALYVVQKFVNNVWVNVKISPALAGTVTSQQNRVNFVPPYLEPDVARGYFRVVYHFSWVDANGRQIAGKSVIPNLTSDHVCVTNVRLCRSYPGYVQTGGYLTGQW